MNGILNLTVLQVALGYVFVLFVLLVLHLRGIDRKKTLVLASVRMTLQLMLTGYVLLWIFDNPHPLFTLGVIAVMETFAIFTVYKKFKGRLSTAMKRVVAIGLATGTLASLAYFLFVVVQISPWYDPQYFIPLAGMLVGNSMTGISLGVGRLLDGMQDNREQVEEALILGATPKKAAAPIVDGAFDAAILPTINSMLGMGIVFLPGMMTGQILSGTLPTTAIAYQIAIMLGILGAVAASVLLMLYLGARTFFNAEDQLIQ